MTLVIYCVMIAWYAFGTATTILSIGKPRHPVTPGLALAVVILTIIQSAAVSYLAMI